MRPLSFTKNIGGLAKVHAAIRRGYAPGVSVPEFRRRCGLDGALSLFVVEFFLCTQVRGDREYIIHDTLVEQTLARAKFDTLLARLYFFAVNLAMPGERLSAIQQEAGALQRFVLGRHIYVNGAWRAERLDKDASLEPFVRSVEKFPSVRKWVNNYWFMMNRCEFAQRPDGTIESFPDTWGLLALNLFFDRHTALHPTDDIDGLVSAALDADLQQLVGVDESWLKSRIVGAADIFLRHEVYDLEIGIEIETKQERMAAKRGEPMPRPKPGTAAHRRQSLTTRLIRRDENRQFIKDLYGGVCQISGTVLRLPSNQFTVDCAHIRPLGSPHRGPDDVGNMLSLSPTMHRLFDKGCIHIDPDTLSIKLLHGNDQQHHARLLVKDGHGLLRDHIAYFNDNILN
jgi:HNH endonuclease